jgi:CheY-like chemotaxis protein
MIPFTLRVLIAEDDDALAKLYSAFARREGHHVVIANDGERALELAAAHDPDVILLDVAMPRMDGREVLKALKEQPETRDIPVLVVSASGGEQEVRTELLLLGAYDVVEKPVVLKTLVAKLEKIIADKGRQ